MTFCSYYNFLKLSAYIDEHIVVYIKSPHYLSLCSSNIPQFLCDQCLCPLAVAYSHHLKMKEARDTYTNRSVVAKRKYQPPTPETYSPGSIGQPTLHSPALPPPQKRLSTQVNSYLIPCSKYNNNIIEKE